METLAKRHRFALDDYSYFYLEPQQCAEFNQFDPHYKVDRQEEYKIFITLIADLVFLQISICCMSGKQTNEMSNEFKVHLI